MLNSKTGICCDHLSSSKPKIHLFGFFSFLLKWEEVEFVSEAVIFGVSQEIMVGMEPA